MPRQNLTGADRTWAERYEVGNVLRYSRASKETGIGKGAYAQVKSIDAPKNRLTVELRDATERTYDPRRQQGVSFRHGPVDVVKYSATPSPDNPAGHLRRSNPNGLQDELIRHVQEDSKMSSFDFGVQFLDTDSMTYWGKRRDANFWIENASIDWNEAQAPFHTIARLTLLPKSHLQPDAAEAVYFDVTGNSTPDSTPLGSVNRARWSSEFASRKARMSAQPLRTTIPDTESEQKSA